jgi:hypothetical protein
MDGYGFTCTRRKYVMTDDDSDESLFNGQERRKQTRRKGNDRRESMRWEMDNPIRRKNPGRRAYDRLLYLLGPKR